MSLVFGYTDGKNAIIMSDGRAGGTVAPPESCNKTRKIKDNIIIGFVGCKESCEHFLKCVHLDMGERIEECYIDEFLEEVEYGMNIDATKEKLKSTFMIIGKTKSGEMRYVICGQDTDFKIKDVPINSMSFIGGTVPISDIREISDRNSKSINSLFELLRKNIEDVSEIDDSVNKNIFFKVI